MNRAEVLERALEAVDRSQAELARRLSLSPATVSRWYSGSSKPDYESALRIALLIGEAPSAVLAAFDHDTSLLPTVGDSSAFQIVGDVTDDQREMIELVLLVADEDVATTKKVLRAVRPTGGPSGRNASKTAPRLFVRKNARSRGHLDIRAARRQSGWSDRSAGWRARLAALPQASGF